MSTPRAYGGMSDSRRPIHTQGALRNSNSSASAFLKRSQVAQSALDILFVVGWFLVATLSGFAFAASIFYFLFV